MESCQPGRNTKQRYCHFYSEPAHPALLPWPPWLALPAAQAWDATTLTCLRTLEGHEDNVRVLALGQGSLFSGSWDKTVRVGASQPACSACPSCSGLPAGPGSAGGFFGLPARQLGNAACCMGVV
jgi:hypothetical protein